MVDADLSKYFDTIPHPEPMRSMAPRIVARDILALLKQWLTAPAETTGMDGGTRMEGARPADEACRKASSSVLGSRTST